MSSCPCCSEKRYEECCAKYHGYKAYPEKAVELMRSRYSAYRLGNAEYIMETTHPAHPDRQKPKSVWKKEIMKFSRSTQFMGLTLIDVCELSHEEALVTFVAHLMQGMNDVSFKEKSRFLKERKRWLYLDGIFLPMSI